VALTGALAAWALLVWLSLRVRAQGPTGLHARYAELQSRIRPHFLFNTLNTAVALVRLDPAQAERVLEDLAELFRAALAAPDWTSTLGEEVVLARRYLDIEALRFGERLRLSWELDPALDGARLPPLLLQPLVENAVRYGVEPNEAGGEVLVRTRRRGGQVELLVRNSLDAPAPRRPWPGAGQRQRTPAPAARRGRPAHGRGRAAALQRAHPVPRTMNPTRTEGSMLTQAPISVLLVDDEALARARLRALLDSCRDPHAEVLAEASTASAAQAWLREHGCDLVLLDVQMPGPDGLMLAEALRHHARPPLVVFVTAHARHAVEAFELDAVDYLTKPVRLERLQAALVRVAQRLQQREALQARTALQQDEQQPRRTCCPSTTAAACCACRWPRCSI
jgi:CheY-like chemotaxis protein